MRLSVTSLLIFVTFNFAFSQQNNADSIISKKQIHIEDFTNSHTEVKSEEFNMGNIGAPLQLIQGKVAGFSISKAGSDPNKKFDIRLRGLGTIYCPVEPLIIIDGMLGASLDNLDPNDIESFHVIKDGSAAIYGLRGSNGVILVTTKQGIRGPLKIEYNGYTSAETVAKSSPSMNENEWRAMSKETGVGTDFKNNSDWNKEITRPAISVVQSIALSGGTDKTSFRGSFNYRNGSGILINTGYSQLNGRINLIQKAFHDKLTIDLNLGATGRKSNYGFDQAFNYASIYNPTAPVRSNDPIYAKYGGYFQQNLFNFYNPVAFEELDKNEGKNSILNASAKGKYEIFKGFSVDAFYSIQKNENTTGLYYDKKDFFIGMNRNGFASRQLINNSISLFESALSYVKDITSVLKVSVLAGYSNEKFTTDGYLIQGSNFPTDNYSIDNIEGAVIYNRSVIDQKWVNIGYFGRLDLNINDMFFISANGRYEGSSMLGFNNKWNLFPSLGAGIDINKLMKTNSANNFKFRVNYGITGNQLMKINISPDIKPEKRNEFDAGIDFSLLKSGISGSIDYYSSLSTDLIVNFFSAVPPNYGGELNMNRSKLKSSGLEMSLRCNFINKPEFTYSISLNPTYILDNTLISFSGLYNGSVVKYGSQDLGDMGAPGQNQVPLTRLEEGKPVGQIIAFIFKTIDSNGNLTFVDVNKDGQINSSDRQVVGNGLPKFLIGFGNNISYKNWYLNIFFRGIFGYDVVNTYRGFYEVPNLISSYNLPVTATDMRNSTNRKLLNATSGTLSSKDIENASFISLDNMSLGYRFRFHENSLVSNVKLYLAGNNLFYLSGYKGADPNPRYTDSSSDMGTYNSPLVPGIDRMNTWARTRSVTFGVNVIF